MTSLVPDRNLDRPDAPREEIPIIDLGPFLAGQPGALERTGEEVRYALENVGFYFIVNHGVAQEIIDRTFELAKRYHSLPLERKMPSRFDENSVGYMPLAGSTIRSSSLNANNKPNLYEGFFMKRDLAPDHPDVVNRRPFRGLNKWPEELPGFRSDAMAYSVAMERLGQSMLPLYAVALGLPPDWFKRAFSDPMFTLLLLHYPQQDVVEKNEFGIAPHTDSSFMTLLAQNELPGLSVGLPNGRWVEAPSVAGSFLVNGGDIMRRWLNERFLATPHRVVNRSGRERYAIPFFMDCNYDWTMVCPETCRSHGGPPRYDPFRYADYMTWSRNVNYRETLASKS